MQSRRDNVQTVQAVHDTPAMPGLLIAEYVSSVK